MFYFKKRDRSEYTDDFIERMIGMILSYREDIIPNTVFMDKQRELNGLIGVDPRRMSDELDYVTLFYVYKFFNHENVGDEEFQEALKRVLRRFRKEKVIDAEEEVEIFTTMISRIQIFSKSGSESGIGYTMMEYVVEGHNALSNDTGRYIAPVLKTLMNNVKQAIQNEWLAND